MDTVHHPPVSDPPPPVPYFRALPAAELAAHRRRGRAGLPPAA